MWGGGLFGTGPQIPVLRLSVPTSAISVQSSSDRDAYAASAFGMRVVWCNRYGQRRERLPGAPDHEITSLFELPALMLIMIRGPNLSMR
jgi:2-haloacid dehalogenase